MKTEVVKLNRSTDAWSTLS